MPITIENKTITITTGRLTAIFEGPDLVELRHQSFAQAHLFNSHHHNCPHLAELDPVPVGDFLYGDLCKTMAYTNIDGEPPETRLHLDVHERLGALPSLQVGRPEQVLQPNDAVRRVLERATS